MLKVALNTKNIRSWWGVLDTTLCDKVCQWLATGRWFSPGTPVSSTIKTTCHDITEILLKVALNTINLNLLSENVILKSQDNVTFNNSYDKYWKKFTKQETTIIIVVNYSQVFNSCHFIETLMRISQYKPELYKWAATCDGEVSE